MGSLKRKNASIGASTGSNKRHSREDASAGSVAANGCTEKRSAEAQTYRPPSSSSSEAADGDAVELVIPTTEALCNGVSPAANTINASLSLTKSDSRKNHTISSNEPACPADSEEQEADIAIVFPESPYSKNLGSLTPNHAGWFSWTSIHAMEQRELPDFFNSKSKLKTPSLYLEYRNLFLRKYLENPDKVFTFAEVSQIIEQKDGHLEAAKRIFGFLNHWGLLNSRAMQHAEVERPTRSKVCITERSSEQPEMSLFSSLYHFNNLAANNSLRSSFAYEMVMPKIVMKESAASDIHGGTQETSIEYHCNSCSADCSKKRFHCQKKADFDLCQDCYNEEKFASGVTSTDFILMDAATDASCGDGWSEQETLLLLEALEMFGDNFSEIAEHVASKTKAQCILHFIRLPIEDQFLDDSGPIAPPVVDPTENANNAELASQMNGQEDFLGSSNGELDQEDEMLDSENSHQVHLLGDEEKSSSTMHAIKAAAEAAGLCSSGKYLALSECSNPVMTLVSFLAALVAPDAVAMSAQTALKLLADHASALQLADKNSFHLELEASPTDGISCIVGEQEEVEMSEAASDVKEITDVGGDTSKPDKGIHNNETSDISTKCSSLVRVKNAATTALAAAAVKAQFLADQEEWEILCLAASIVDSQTKKIETKLRLFRELDSAFEKEHNQLEKTRRRLFAERSQIAGTRTQQPFQSGHYSNLTGGIVGVRPPSVQRFPTGSILVPPVSAIPCSPSPHKNYIGPHMRSQGTNMVSLQPMYYNNAQI